MPTSAIANTKTVGYEHWRTWVLPSIVIAILAVLASVAPTSWSRGVSSSSLPNSNLAWPLDAVRTHKLIVPNDGYNTDNDDKKERTLIVEKLSSYPPIFRVKNFLTPVECATLRRLAVDQGLQKGYVDSDDGLLAGPDKKSKKKMGIFDTNSDGRLSVHELIRMVDDFFESHVSESDIIAMLSNMNLALDKNQLNTVSIHDFVRSDTAAMRRYFSELIRKNPSKLSRHSEMAWLTSISVQDEEGRHVMESIRKRVALLTRLPEHVVHRDMEMQVVHYDPPENVNDGDNIQGGGHYTAHFDSLSPSPLPCCHITNREPPCRSCRMATVLYSLSDEGGHTAFPLSTGPEGRKEIHTAETIEDWRVSSSSRETSYCADDGPGLRIQPELGQAILWYNHEIDHLQTSDTTASSLDMAEQSIPLLGGLDRSTIHAGCPSMIRDLTSSTTREPGEALWNAPGKWIANNWIEASDTAGEDEERFRTI